MKRPVLYVLAGVNGAGKSSIGGAVLRDAGLDWFDPDDFARGLVRSGGLSQQEANAEAWNEGFRRLRLAIERNEDHAFETTLGGDSIAEELLAAAKSSHDVIVWFCGLESAERHVARVRARVAVGGHDIPEDKIRERFDASRRNLARLIPVLSGLQVYDNSREVRAGRSVPDPKLVVDMDEGELVFPAVIDAGTLAACPEWARPILEAAIRRCERRR